LNCQLISHGTQKPQHDAEKHLATVFWWSLWLFALLAFSVYLRYNYTIKACSDPLNWLRWASDLRSSFSSSVFPIVYPLYLRAGLNLLGRIYVFFWNYPLLVLTAVCAGRLAFDMLEESPLPLRRLGALIAIIFVLSFDPGLQIQMLNPYRDPLAHVFMLAGIIVLAREARKLKASMLNTAVSGVCLGLAYATREPSILYLPWALCFLAYSCRGQPIHCMASRIAVFAGGVLLGASVFLVQTCILTGQMILPAKSVHTGHYLPGFRIEFLVGNAEKMVDYVISSKMKILLSAGFLIGTGRCVFKRDFKPLVLLGLPAVFFAIFYCFYRIFVVRYFFAVCLLAAPLAAYGLCAFFEFRIPRIGCPGRFRALPALVGAAFSILFAVHLFFNSDPSDPDRCKVRDAFFLQDLCAKRFQTDSFVLAERNLCEFIEWLGRRESLPAAWLLSPGQVADIRLVSEKIGRMISSGRPVYLLDSRHEKARTATGFVVRRIVDASPDGMFLDASAAKRFRWLQDDDVHVYRLSCPTTRVLNVRVPLKAPGANILQIDRGAGNGPVQLIADGQMLDADMPPYSQYYAVTGVSGQTEISITLVAEHPQPSHISVRTLSGSEAITLSFRLDQPFFHRSYLSGTFSTVPFALDPYACVLSGAPCVWIPAPWKDARGVMFDFKASDTELLTRNETFQSEISDRMDTANLPLRAVEQRSHRHYLCLDDAVRKHKGTFVKLPLDFPSTSVIILDTITLMPIKAASYEDVDVGETGDMLLIRKGFYSRERHPSGRTFRWTGEYALMECLAEKKQPCLFKLELLEDLVPEQVRATPPRVLWNGNELTPFSQNRLARGITSIQFSIGEHMVQEGWNRIELRATPWSPVKLCNSRDSRILGVALDRICIIPAK